MPSFVKFSLEIRDPGAGFGKAANAKLITKVDRPLHSTCLERGLSRTEQQLLLTVPTVRNVSCIADVLSNELIT